MKKSEKKSFVTAGVSFPTDLYNYAQRQAAADDRSLSYYIQSLIKKEMKNAKKKGTRKEMAMLMANLPMLSS